MQLLAAFIDLLQQLLPLGCPPFFLDCKPVSFLSTACLRLFQHLDLLVRVNKLSSELRNLFWVALLVYQLPQGLDLNHQIPDFNELQAVTHPCDFTLLERAEVPQLNDLLA